MAVVNKSQFTVENLTLTDKSRRTPYRQRTNENKTAIHWGQRKLHLGEVEFFTVYWDSKKIPNPICVYAGAAPCTHINLISEMFPAFKFHLYDPCKFDVTNTDRIIIHNEYFTNEIAAQYAGRNDVFFISDIRTADYKNIQRNALKKRGIVEFDKDGLPIGPRDLVKEALREAEINNEDQIWGDMIMQQNWVLTINPEHAFLKFRLPYVLDNKERIVQYLRGTVYWQIWSPQTSTETRLKPLRGPNGNYELSNWSTLEYEQWAFHHNTADREQTFYTNIFTNTDDPVDYPELLNDFDSMAEAMIIKLYLEKLGMKNINDIYEKVKSLSRLITWSINHYRIDDKGAQSLDLKRKSPVKSTNKAAIDAFRAKRKTKAINVPGTYEHKQVDINKTWRQGPNRTSPRGPNRTSPRGPKSPVVQPITPTIQPVVQPITPTIQPVVQPITPTIQPVVQPITPTITPVVQPIIPTIQPVVQPIIPTITPVVQPIIPAIQPVVQPIIPAIQPVVQPIIPAIQTVVQPIIPAIQPVVQPITPRIQPITPTIQPIIQPITPTIQPIIQPITPITRTIQPTIPTFTPVVQPIIPAITPRIQPVVQPITPTFNPVVQPLTPTFNPVIQPITPTGNVPILRRSPLAGLIRPTAPK